MGVMVNYFNHIHDHEVQLNFGVYIGLSIVAVMDKKSMHSHRVGGVLHTTVALHPPT